MKTRKITIAVICAACLSLTAFSAFAVERLSIGTGGTTGTYYPIGSGIASVISRNLPDVKITAETTGGSVANLKMLRGNRVDMILAAANTSWGAYNGKAPFDKKPVKNLRGVSCLYPEVFQFIVLANSDIKSIEDLKGKKISVGAAGSGTERTAKMILGAHGLTYDDVKEQYLKFGESVTALKDRLIDCAIVGSGLPTSAVVDASTTLDIRFLPVDAKTMSDFCKDRPYLMTYEIPAKTYRNQDSPILSVASPAIWSVYEDMDEGLVYKMTKTLFENIDEMAAVHAQGKNVKLSTALSAMSIPLHPGAEKYYREVGLIK